MELQEFKIEISQNGWEYTGWATVTAKQIEKVNDTTILADGIKIQFDEEIKMPDEQ